MPLIPDREVNEFLAHLNAQEAGVVETDSKECSKCHKIKPMSEYHHDKSRLDGYRNDCIECFRSRLGTRKYRTKKEREEAVRFVISALRRGLYDHEIAWELRQRPGNTFDIVNHTIQLARAVLRQKYAPRDRHGKPDPKGLVLDAIAVYDGIIRDPQARHADIIAAQSRKDRLLGLETIKIHAIVDTTIKAEITVRSIAEIAQKDDRVRDAVLQLARALPQGAELQ